jgi:hypothetical protein
MEVLLPSFEKLLSPKQNSSRGATMACGSAYPHAYTPYNLLQFYIF